MAEKIYSESDWAVRRWDRFNDRLVKPLSFCHFWRTVLLYATIQQLLSPMRMVERLARRFKRFAPLGVLVLVALVAGGGGTILGGSFPVYASLGFALGAVLGIWMVFGPKLSEDVMIKMGEIHLGFWRRWLNGLWLLAWPFRTFFPPLGRGLVAGVVTVGEPVERYVQRHKAGLETIGSWALAVVCVAIGGFVIVVLLISATLVTLAVLGILAVIFVAGMVGIPQAFWRFFVAVMGLLWGAAVATKHGICPPVTILRREV